jgi:hypothetical protein
MSEPWGINDIVVNFNYECSLPAAIDSAPFQESSVLRLCQSSSDNPRQKVSRCGDGSDP